MSDKAGVEHLLDTTVVQHERVQGAKSVADGA